MPQAFENVVLGHLGPCWRRSSVSHDKSFPDHKLILVLRQTHQRRVQPEKGLGRFSKLPQSSHYSKPERRHPLGSRRHGLRDHAPCLLLGLVPLEKDDPPATSLVPK